ncbi:MAG: hypothetical protein ACK56I_10975, partial [bacterium]
MDTGTPLIPVGSSLIRCISLVTSYAFTDTYIGGVSCPGKSVGSLHILCGHGNTIDTGGQLTH